MAFSFGSGAPAFGAAPASSGGFSFGGSPAPAFGAPAASSGGFSFGGAAAPAPAASSGGFSFGGAAAAPAPAASSGGFGFSSALVPAAAPASPFGGFGAPPAASAAAAAPAAAPAGAGALTYSSKFDDLPAQVKSAFEQLQQQVSQYESDRAAVGRMDHLQEAPSGGRDVGAEAAALQSELRAVQGSMAAEAEALANFREKAVQLLKATDGVVRTFQRTKLWRDAPTQFKGQVMPTAMQELLSQPVMLPSPFLEQVAAGFADRVSEFKKAVAELEQALAAQGGAAAAADGAGLDATTALPAVVANLHDYLTHVAAKMERVHCELQAAKAAHRAALRAQGIYRDPFERAQAHAEKLAKARALAPPLLPPPASNPAGAGAGADAGAPGGAAGAQLALPAPGGFGGGGGGFGFGSPFPGTPGAYGAPQGAALGRTSSKTGARNSKSRR
ncbi:hypothetical protein Rsub_01366 [Raphidocelis subcapitata]|uniref:Uncharacterized protein n=1 Tax=Raphidocelis subcapitata TaxID=307507 RepID=A0A2V0NV97_9CHLO|nr:hypothetical protein Rsub_01366 [Raphidocelis subcapitata]|eukprot:GBF88867.1 hypothetical protein Rsub_01366 [Raphidocelis subcapitata]